MGNLPQGSKYPNNEASGYLEPPTFGYLDTLGLVSRLISGIPGVAMWLTGAN